MQNKNILIGITGGIAAYKSAELIRLLRKAGAKIKVVMTKSAKEFITPLTMQTLSGNVVYDDMFSRLTTSALDHIELAQWADAIVVAPATANFIAKIANGLADDLLTTICLASPAPIAIAPAMNKHMWANSATQENINKLTQRGIYTFGPASGIQACGDLGDGRMLEANEIYSLTITIFAKPLLTGKKVLITAGPTREAIDPVRYISNFSSGKMGYAIASAACETGATVCLISGPTNLAPHPKANFVSIETANDMYEKVMAMINDCDIFIATAAVADYSVAKTPHKIKKTKDIISLQLIPNPDILATVAALPNPPFCVGFAAETENLLANAKAKLCAKNIDMIFANEVGANKGFAVDENELVVLQKNQDPIFLPRTSKKLLAMQIIEIIANALVEFVRKTRA